MRFILIFIAFVFTLSVFGQIITDRPTQSFSPYVQSPNTVNIETGLIYDKVRNGVNQHITNFNTVLRYGLLKWMEARMGTNFLRSNDLGTITGEWSPLTFGSKIHINDQKNNHFPQTSILANYTLPKDITESITDIRFLFQENISNTATLAFNIGGVRQKNQQIFGVYSLMLGLSLTNDLGLFLELYGQFAKDLTKPQSFNIGSTYLLSNSFQLDASVGNGLNHLANDYFLSCGASICFGGVVD